MELFLYQQFCRGKCTVILVEYDGIDGVVSQGPSKQNSISANRYIAFTDSLYLIDSVVFQCFVSVCFVLFYFGLGAPVVKLLSGYGEMT